MLRVTGLAMASVLALAVVGCALVPTAQPTKPPLPKPLGDIIRVSVVDWLDDKPAAVILRGTGAAERYEIDVADVASGGWNRLPAIGQIDLDRIASDGTLVALAGQPETTLQDHVRLVDQAGKALDVDASTQPWIREWRFWGGLTRMPGGGFILARIATIATIARDGAVASSVLPANFLLQAPTSDPDLFLVGKIGTDMGAEARLPAATGVNIFRRTTGALTHVDASVAQILPSSTHLAFLLTTDNRWLSLDANGMTHEIGIAGTDEGSIAPDGGRAVRVSATGDVTMISLPGGASVAVGPGPVLSKLTWGPTGQVAYWTEDPAVGKKLVILSSDGMSLLAAAR